MDNLVIDTIDKKENFIRLKVDSKIYSLDTIFAAGYVFLDRVYILLDKGKATNILVYLFPLRKEKDLRKLGFEFFNELLNYAHYSSRAKINAEVVKTIMQRALFSASPALGRELVQEAEEKEIQDLIKDLEKEEGMEDLSRELKNEPAVKKRKR